MMAAAGVHAAALKSAIDELPDSLVGASCNAAEESDAVLRQEPLTAAADAAADKGADALVLQKGNDFMVLRPAGVLYPGRDNLSVLNLVELELARHAEMREYVSVIVSNCCSHIISFFHLPRTGRPVCLKRRLPEHFRDGIACTPVMIPLKNESEDSLTKFSSDEEGPEVRKAP